MCRALNLENRVRFLEGPPNLIQWLRNSEAEWTTFNRLVEISKFSGATIFMSTEKIDRIIRNANLLGKLAYYVDLYDSRGYFTTDNQEHAYARYHRVLAEQIELLGCLQSGI